MKDQQKEMQNLLSSEYKYLVVFHFPCCNTFKGEQISFKPKMS